MKVLPSVILSAYTGRQYSDMPPTMLFGPIIKFFTKTTVATVGLPNAVKAILPQLLSKCPKDLQKTITEWKHSDDWAERCNALDSKFGEIEI